MPPAPSPEGPCHAPSVIGSLHRAECVKSSKRLDQKIRNATLLPSESLINLLYSPLFECKIKLETLQHHSLKTADMNQDNMSERDPRTKEQSSTHDTERNIQPSEEPKNKENVSAFKSLGWLDRFLAVWIFLAMVVGIILGNFVPSTGPALEKGKFVGVSVPIGI